MIKSARSDSQFQTVASGVYWAIVTMPTVGYGDVVPQTELGRLLASVVMLLGFGIIAIPTGILTVSGVRLHQQRSVELAEAKGRSRSWMLTRQRKRSGSPCWRLHSSVA